MEFPPAARPPRTLRSARWFGPIAAVAALTIAAMARSETIQVTETGDYGEGKAPIVGSLRWAVEVQAASGDTIQVDLAKPVRLKRDLALDPSLQDVTILGSGTIRTRRSGSSLTLTLLGPGQALQGTGDRLKLVDLEILITAPTEKIRINRIRMKGNARIVVLGASQVSITESKFDTDLRPVSGPITTSGADALVVEGNEIKSPPKRPVKIENGEDLTFRDNELTGSALLTPRSGTVEDNRIPTGTLSVGYTSIGIPGLVTVQRNTVQRLVVKRYHTDVTDNTIDAPKNATAVVLRSTVDPSLFDPDPQPLTVTQNHILAGGDGISYKGSEIGSAPTVISENRIANCSRVGILVLEASDVELSGNRIKKCNGPAGILVDDLLGPGVTIGANIIKRGVGAGISVVASHPISVEGNAVNGAAAVGILASTNEAGFVDLQDNDVVGTNGPGVQFGKGARGRISGGTVHRNGKAGVLVGKDARIEISEVSFTENGGPGIDLVPGGVTPNDAPKKANLDLDWPEALGFEETGKFAGTTLPGARVEIFVVEGGKREGNPKNGEGITYLGSATADGAGDFRYPAEGGFDCTDIKRLTTTATVIDDGTPYTSEFSRNVKCDVGSGAAGDEDKDGVEDSSDACPGTSESISVDENGCAATVTGIDGGHSAYCNDPLSCDFGGGFGSCTGCAVGTLGELEGICFAGGTCTVVPGGELSVLDGTVEGPGATLECNGDGCLLPADGDVVCTGQGDDCALDFASGDADACPTGEPCTVIVDRDLFADPLADPVSATIRKNVSEQNGGFADGDFPFFGPGLVVYDGPTTDAVIRTTDGVGDQRLRFWRNRHPATPVVQIGEVVPTGYSLGALDCNGPVDPRAFTLPDGTTVAQGFEATLAEKLRCTFTNDFVPPSGGIVPTPITDLELIVETKDAFGLGPGRRVTASGSNGAALLDLDTGSVASVDGNLVQFTTDFLPWLGTLLLPSPLGDEGDTLVHWHPATSLFRTYDPVAQAFPSFLGLRPGADDQSYLGGEPSTEGALIVRGRNLTNAVPAGGGSREYDTGIPVVDSFAWTNQAVTPVAAYAQAAGAPPIVVTAGSPGQLWVTDPSQMLPADQVALVGAVGNDPRQLRCRNGICGITNCGSNSLTIATWNGAQSASITATAPVGACPIGLDVEPLGDGAVFLSTGFDDDTFTVTQVSSGGATVANDTAPTPDGCTRPTSGVLFDDGSLAIGCNGEGVIAVIEDAWPAP